MKSARVTAAELCRRASEDLVGAVLLARVRLPSGDLPKGTRLDGACATLVIRAAREMRLEVPVRLAWPEADELHEDEAALRLARAVAGHGIVFGPPRQSRIELSAQWDGVLHVRASGLHRLNAIDPLEVFSLYHGQAVRADQAVGGVKVAPHLVPASAIERGESIAHREQPLLSVAPYLPLRVAAVAAEAVSPDALQRFATAARTKVEALTGIFHELAVASDPDPAVAESKAWRVLEQLVLRRNMQLLLVGGVSAGDPLAPFFAAFDAHGGHLVRRGVPAHPGSMIWLGVLHGCWLLGLPQCGMFSMATAADLILPRLMTGEMLTAESVADLAHGGLLSREMRFRFPEYARDLAEPDAP